jgi:hypothetical protein
MIELTRALGRIEGTLIGIHTEQKRIADYTAALSRRIGTLEIARGWAIGWAAGAGALAAIVIAALKGVLHWKG